MKATLIVMCGLQASGKSTKAKELAKTYNATIIASDEIRKNNPELANDKIFKQLYLEVNNSLKENKNVIIDATNITIKSRKSIFTEIKYPCYKICYLMNTPYPECVKRLEDRNNSNYSNKIPFEVLQKYYYSFEIPFYEEGWDNIIIDNTPNYLQAIKVLNILKDCCKGFDQRNKHHTHNLGEHMTIVGDSLVNLLTSSNRRYNKTNSMCLIQAGYYHDIGKLFTQTFKEGDLNAHYYNHANVGAYNLMCTTGLFKLKHELCGEYINDNDIFDYDKDNTLKWLFYINYHMHLYNIQSEKAYKKWVNIFGEHNYQNLELLHQADQSNHVLEEV